MANQNLEMLRAAVRRLKDLSNEMVFVGGCTTELLITDVAADQIRPTDDVDAIVEATSYVQYMKLADRLKEVGFKQDTREDAPLCRWVNEETVLDVMPLDEKILGFANRWYKDAITQSVLKEIMPGIHIKVISPPFFCVTKLEAFANRGNSDFYASHDLEDLVAVIDGRREIVDEIRSVGNEVRLFIVAEVGKLLRSTGFIDALPGHLPGDAASQARLPDLISRLKEISELS